MSRSIGAVVFSRQFSRPYRLVERLTSTYGSIRAEIPSTILRIRLRRGARRVTQPQVRHSCANTYNREHNKQKSEEHWNVHRIVLVHFKFANQTSHTVL